MRHPVNFELSPSGLHLRLGIFDRRTEKYAIYFRLRLDRC